VSVTGGMAPFGVRPASHFDATTVQVMVSYGPGTVTVRSVMVVVQYRAGGFDFGRVCFRCASLL
jgi:hypothetical protein